MRATIRPYDICVRYAGDEFIVVLSGCSQEEAERKRIELQHAVDAVVFEARPGRRIPLAISIGAAIYPVDGETYESLLATADNRMYRDKTRRKQRAASHALGADINDDAGNVNGTGSDERDLDTVPLTQPGEPTPSEIRRASLGVL